MKSKRVLKIVVDVLMTITLIFQMTFELIGRATHEWLGMWMFFLFVMHHILNGSWVRAVCKGKYNAYRILQTVLVTLVFVCMMGSMVSGIMLSRYVFAFFPIRGGSAFARFLHMLCAYWGFTLMSIHLGLHWGMMLTAFRRMMKLGAAAPKRKNILRMVAIVIAGYGCCALLKRSLFGYMFFRTQFVFFDFGEPLVFFILDYLAMMALFVFVGYYVSQGTKKKRRKVAAE